MAEDHKTQAGFALFERTNNAFSHVNRSPCHASLKPC
jgi:hypothetical protein